MLDMLGGGRCKIQGMDRCLTGSECAQVVAEWRIWAEYVIGIILTFNRIFSLYFLDFRSTGRNSHWKL